MRAWTRKAVVGVLGLVVAVLAAGIVGVPAPARATKGAPNDRTCQLIGHTGAFATGTPIAPLPSSALGTYISDNGFPAYYATVEAAVSGGQPATRLRVYTYDDQTQVVDDTLGGDLVAFGFSSDQHTVVLATRQATGKIYRWMAFRMQGADPATSLVPAGQRSLRSDMDEIRVGFSPNQEFVAAATRDTTNNAFGITKVVDAVTGQQVVDELTTYTPALSDQVQFGPDDGFVALGASNTAPRTPKFFNADRPSPAGSGWGVGGSGIFFPRVTFAPDGSAVAYVRYDGVNHVWLGTLYAPDGSTIFAESIPDPTGNTTLAYLRQADGYHHLVNGGGAATLLAPPITPPYDGCPPKLTGTLGYLASGALDWSTTTRSDNIAITGYRILDAAGVAVDQVGPGATQYQLKGLAVGTPYTFAVVATDAAGNLSAPLTVTFTPATSTPVGPWTWTGPITSAPPGLDSVALTLPSVTGHGAPVRYRLFRDGTPVTDLAFDEHTFTDTGLSPGTGYTYRIHALDAGGNESPVASDPTLEVVTPSLTNQSGYLLDGKVYADSDGNGAQGPGEPGLGTTGAGIRIKAVTLDAEGAAVLDHTVDVAADGSWHDSSNTPGTWLVWPVANGAGERRALVSPAAPYRLPIDATGWGWRGVDYGLSAVGAAPGHRGSLSALVYRDTNANGQQDPGETPVPGVPLSCSATAAATSDDCTGTTGGDGRVTFTGLPDGVYRIVPPRSAERYAVNQAARYGRVSAEGPGTVKIGLYDAAGSLHGSLVEDVAGDGQADGDPALPDEALGTVRVVGPAPGNGIDLTVPVHDGQWSLTGLPPGDYAVTQAVGPNAGWSLTTPATATVTVGAGAVTAPTGVVAHPNGAAHGTLYFDLDADGARDPGEPPVDGVEVCVRTWVQEIPHCDTTDAAGQWRVTRVAAGGSSYSELTLPTPGPWTLQPSPALVGLVAGQDTRTDVPLRRDLATLPPWRAPIPLEATAREGAVALTWDAPATIGEPAPTGYEVQRAGSAAGPWTTLGTVATTSYDATGLANGVPVHFRVRAVNGNGPGPWSAVATATPTGPVVLPPTTQPPGPVTRPALRAKPHRRVVATWAAVPGASSYVVQVRTKRGGPWRSVTVAGPRAVVRGKAGRKVWVRVAAVNGAGQGAWSPAAKAVARR
ncbi:SdrD B-like domain-containing protein [Nocardioides nitrophenolicus]|uniref:SdrD B-like domain-containing protein n=1 Tax=Nocardioides nitrophenolicus TaxID=60489 RepID=UPI00195C7BE5|nr:fibronectin type III domain-containing protein [Nocardioides nitrophenolicus]MBM7515916.1 hypothetical protein [Nocardioides nitrophenolicus]